MTKDIAPPKVDIDPLTGAVSEIESEPKDPPKKKLGRPRGSTKKKVVEISQEIKDSLPGKSGKRAIKIQPTGFVGGGAKFTPQRPVFLRPRFDDPQILDAMRTVTCATLGCTRNRDQSEKEITYPRKAAGLPVLHCSGCKTELGPVELGLMTREEAQEIVNELHSKGPTYVPGALVTAGAPSLAPPPSNGPQEFETVVYEGTP